MNTPLVSTEWLAEHLSDPNLRIVDASWHMPDAKRDARTEYETAHIPGAQFFDIDALSDQNTTLPHMLPEADIFARGMRALGIGNSDFVVTYDSAGMFSAPRAWWMFRVFGHQNVAVLDGGLPKWKREGGALDSKRVSLRPSHFIARRQDELIRHAGQLRDNLDNQHEQVVDARGPGRFAGTEPEPRAGVASGHIPRSANVHYASLLDRDGVMLEPDKLRALFKSRDIDLDCPLVTSCGSGVTACMLMLALERAGAKQVSVYDGSWAEWGSRPDLPKELA